MMSHMSRSSPGVGEGKRYLSVLGDRVVNVLLVSPHSSRANWATTEVTGEKRLQCRFILI